MVGRPRLEAAQDLEFSTKKWKSVDFERTSANVMTNEQIAAADASQKAAAAAPAAVVSAPVEAAPAAAAPSAAGEATIGT